MAEGAPPVAESPLVSAALLGLRPDHIGFIGADLDVGMAEIGAALGLRWCEPVRDTTIALRAAGTPVTWGLSYVFSSRDADFVVELIQGESGTSWHAATGVAFHHWAYAPADRHQHHDVLAAAGWDVELSRDVDDPATSSFCYYRKPGMRIELCRQP